MLRVERLPRACECLHIGNGSDLVFPLATISANFSCLEFRRTGIALPLIYRLGLLALRRDAALDWGGFCADLLTEGVDFVGMPK